MNKNENIVEKLGEIQIRNKTNQKEERGAKPLPQLKRQPSLRPLCD